MGSAAWHGLPQCPGCVHWASYCCAAFVFGSGWRLGVGLVDPASPGFGLGWVCLGTVSGVVPLLPAVCGFCGWTQVSACLWDVCGCLRAPLAPRRFRFRCAVWACVLWFAFRLRPASPWGGVGVCVCSCARPAWSPAPPDGGCCAGVRVCARAPLVPCLSWLGCGVCACVLGPGLCCAPPLLIGLSGCVVCASFFGRVLVWLCGVGFWLSLSRALWSLSPHLLCFGLGCWLFFFFPHVSVSLFPVGRCSWLGVAGSGWVVTPCLFGGPVFGAFWLGGLAASCGVGWRLGGCGLFSRPPPLPPLCLFFLGGGGGCSSLCSPWAGASTRPHSVLSSGLLLAVAFCLAVFRPHGSGGLCTRWARRPFLPG